MINFILFLYKNHIIGCYNLYLIHPINILCNNLDLYNQNILLSFYKIFFDYLNEYYYYPNIDRTNVVVTNLRNYDDNQNYYYHNFLRFKKI